MTENYAYVEIATNVVINVFVGPPNSSPPDGFLFIPLNDKLCSKGWIWDGNNFINPNPEPPIITE